MQEEFNNVDLNDPNLQNFQKIDILDSRRSSFEQPAEPVTLSWQLNAFVNPKKNIFKKLKERIRPPEQDDVKHILKNVNGIIKPGQLCAIMGASGAGKTTLLNALNFRNRGSLKVEGDVKINGKKADWDLITRYSGYVQQDDLFIGTMTVREHLTFIAMLKMSKDFTREERLERVDQVLTDLNLMKAENTFIGQGHIIKGISGGEKRRLAFASEIITNPPLLFCDEPTTGLDSFMAQTIIESMKSLTDAGKTVICTIHQPSSQVFELFNTLCLLAEGRTVYLGPRNDAMQYFSNIGYPVPHLYNPADFYIQTLAIDLNDRENSLLKVKMIADNYEQGPINEHISNEIKVIEQYASTKNEEEDYPRKYSASYGSQFYWLLRRQFRNDFRNPMATRVLAGQTVVIGSFIGLIFLQLTMNQVGVQNKIGVLFILLMQCTFGYAFTVVQSYPLELQLVYREIKNRYYSSTPYFCVKQLAELPKYIILPACLVTIVYWMTNIYNDGSVFISILAIFVITVQVATSFGTLVSIASPDINAALAVMIPILMPLLIFAGFFLGNRSAPDYFIWLKYLSWFYYANEAINIKLWTNVKTIECEAPRNVSSCFLNGNDVLQQSLKMDPGNYSRNVGLLILLAFVPRIFSFVILRLKVKRQ